MVSSSVCVSQYRGASVHIMGVATLEQKGNSHTYSGSRVGKSSSVIFFPPDSGRDMQFKPCPLSLCIGFTYANSGNSQNF